MKGGKYHILDCFVLILPRVESFYTFRIFEYTYADYQLEGDHTSHVATQELRESVKETGKFEELWFLVADIAVRRIKNWACCSCTGTLLVLDVLSAK